MQQYEIDRMAENAVRTFNVQMDVIAEMMGKPHSLDHRSGKDA